MQLADLLLIPSRSCSDLRCIDGHRRNPICCLAEFFTRCAQVLPQPVCSLSLRRPALLYSTRSERCDYSWSFRLWLPIVKTCAHRAKIFSGTRARFRLSFSESARRGQNEAICEELPIDNLPSKKPTWANREPCAANLLHRGFRLSYRRFLSAKTGSRRRRGDGRRGEQPLPFACQGVVSALFLLVHVHMDAALVSWALALECVAVTLKARVSVLPRRRFRPVPPRSRSYGCCSCIVGSRARVRSSHPEGAGIRRGTP